MKAADIQVGTTYAYKPTGGLRYEIGAAVVVTAPDRGTVTVDIQHPAEQQESGAGRLDWRTVHTRELLGEWNSTPEPDSDASFQAHEGMSFAESANVEFEKVLQQRELADRLNALNIPRDRRPWLGRGETERCVTADQAYRFVGELTYDELALLLHLAERSRPVAWLVTDLVPGGDPDEVSARTTLYAIDQLSHAQDYAKDPGPVERQLVSGELRVFGVTR